MDMGRAKQAKKWIFYVSAQIQLRPRLEEKFGLRCLLQQLATYKTTSFSKADLKVGQKNKGK